MHSVCHTERVHCSAGQQLQCNNQHNAVHTWLAEHSSHSMVLVLLDCLKALWEYVAQVVQVLLIMS